MPFVVGEPMVPVPEVMREIDLFDGPEGGLGPFVHLPDLKTQNETLTAVKEFVSLYLIVLYREEHKATGGLSEQRLTFYQKVALVLA